MASKSMLFIFAYKVIKKFSYLQMDKQYFVPFREKSCVFHQK